MKEAMLRRYVAEFIGTFGIVFAPVALSAVGGFSGADKSLAAASWVSGLVVLAMIYALGHISAAHFNPAVTLGFAVAKRFPWQFVMPTASRSSWAVSSRRDWWLCFSVGGMECIFPRRTLSCERSGSRRL